MQLPSPMSIDFPAALKAARIEKGLSRSALARAAHIHPVMPRRYEEPDCGEFTRPTTNTWMALNRALGFLPDAEDVGSEPELEAGAVSLRDASIEQIVEELHLRNIQPSFVFLKSEEEQAV